MSNPESFTSPEDETKRRFKDFVLAHSSEALPVDDEASTTSYYDFLGMFPMPVGTVEFKVVCHNTAGDRGYTYAIKMCSGMKPIYEVELDEVGIEPERSYFGARFRGVEEQEGETKLLRLATDLVDYLVAGEAQGELTEM